jgi:hypothetical protein
VPDEPPAAVLAAFGLAAFGLAAFGAGRREVTGLSDVPDGNANWLISGDSGHLVLDWPLSPLEESAAGPVYQAVRAGLAAWPMEQGPPHRAVRPGRDRAPAGPLRDPAALNRLYGVRLAAARRRPRAEEESAIGTTRPALPRPNGGMLP